MMPPRRGKRSPSIIDCLLRKRRVPKLTQRHLAQRHHDAAPPFLRQHLPNRRRRTFAHRGIQANAPGRAALGIQLSVIRRISSIYQRYCQWYIERCFANLKDVIDMRPVFHQTADRVEAHIFVAALAFLIHRAIEKKLKAPRPDLSAPEALTILKSIRVVDIDLGNGTTKRSVTAGTQRAAAVLRAIGITDLDPPTPPTPGQTVM